MADCSSNSPSDSSASWADYDDDPPPLSTSPYRSRGGGGGRGSSRGGRSHKQFSGAGVRRRKTQYSSPMKAVFDSKSTQTPANSPHENRRKRSPRNFQASPE